jgi:phage terminase small subunit
LDPKRRRFVEEYRIDWNATQAAIRAGYSRKTAQEQGSQLLSKLMVQEALAEVMAEDSARCRVSVDDAISELTRVAFLNIMDYMRIGSEGDPYVDLSALTRDRALGLVSFECEDYKDGRGEDARDVRRVKIRVADKVRALAELLKHIKPQIVIDGDVIDIAKIEAREKMRIEKLEEIAARYLPAPKTEKAAKAKAGSLKSHEPE